MLNNKIPDYTVEHLTTNYLVTLSEETDCSFSDLEELAFSISQDDPVYIIMPYQEPFTFQHITDEKFALNILKSGLLAGETGVFGDGVYVYDPYSDEACDNIYDYVEEELRDTIVIVQGEIPPNTDKLFTCIYGPGHIGYAIYKDKKIPRKWIDNTVLPFDEIFYFED